MIIFAHEILAFEARTCWRMPVLKTLLKNRYNYAFPP